MPWHRKPNPLFVDHSGESFAMTIMQVGVYMSDVKEHQLVCHVTITRASSDDLQQRDVIAALDGDEIARLMDGESRTTEILPGHHRLRVDNTWNRKTVEFDAAPGEHPKFLVTNRAGSLSQFFKFTFGGGPTYVEIQRLS